MPQSSTRRSRLTLSMPQVVLPAWLALGLAFGALGCAPEDDGNEGFGGAGGGAGTGGGNSPPGAPTPSGPGLPPPPPRTEDPGGGGSGNCRAGYYRGGFVGDYRSPAAFGLPLIVSAADDPLRGPGLELTLEESGEECPPSVEFCFDFVVSGGKIRGVADPLSDGSGNPSEGSLFNVEFEIDLTGELDCSRGVFRGELRNGRYNAFLVDYFFEGTLEATYDHATSSFINGTWETQETDQGPLPPPEGFGGEGTWHAAFMDN